MSGEVPNVIDTDFSPTATAEFTARPWSWLAIATELCTPVPAPAAPFQKAYRKTLPSGSIIRVPIMFPESFVVLVTFSSP